jgi:hypothetical protein
LYPPVVAWQWFVKYVPATTNTHVPIQEFKITGFLDYFQPSSMKPVMRFPFDVKLTTMRPFLETDMHAVHVCFFISLRDLEEDKLAAKMCAYSAFSYGSKITFFLIACRENIKLKIDIPLGKHRLHHTELLTGPYIILQ